jgi:DNA polymerase-3 subunit gamma/tau
VRSTVVYRRRAAAALTIEAVSYLVLARKYRPQSFEDLVGQEHVAKTLANAIALGRVAHAFLFTGVRGVGKTTSARLLAKCLNCLGPDGKATGPTAIPCQVCAACTEIASGTDMDVQEIDGASYNGVDEVRRLQEGLAFRPARDRFKIYIVDEVHMLSNAAWNAFLKTLEEPPPHVKFIFATTEVHKVPVTILSRCQRYDFKLLTTQTIVKRLKHVLALEAIEAEDAAVSVLAREAAGSMRDAMSLLDQVIAFSGQKLSAEDVARVLGVAERRVLHDIAGALVKGDALAALRVVDGIAQQGLDIAHTARDLLRHLRDMVVAKVAGEGARDLLDLADEEARDVAALAETAELDDLTRLYQGFSRGFDDVVRSGQPRAALEMMLVRLARRPPLLPLDELLHRVAELEKRLAGASPSPSPRGGGGPGGGGARSTATSITSELRSAGTRAHPDAPFTAPEIAPESRGPRASAGAEHARPITSVGPRPPAKRPSSAPQQPWDGPYPGTDAHGALALAVAPAIASVATAPSPSIRRREIDPAFQAPNVERGEGAEPPLPSRPSTEPIAPLVHTVGADDLETFRTVIARVRSVKAPLAALFESAVVLEVGRERVRLAYEAHSFLAAQASDPEALDLLTREVRAHFGAATAVELDLSAKSLAGKATLAGVAIEQERARTAAARAAALAHPMVQRAVHLFDAEVREIRLSADDAKD